MTLFAILNMIQIIIMGYIVLFLSCRISEMRYSLYFCIARWIFYRDKRYIKWLKSNSYYITYYFLTLSLIATCLTLIGQFMSNNIFNKPIFVFVIAPFLWWYVYKVLKSYDKRLKKV